MATVTPTVEDIGPSTRRVTWAGMVTGDTILAHNAGALCRGAVQAFGTFAGGTAIGLNVSLNGTTFAPAVDTSGSAVSGKNAAFILPVETMAVAFQPTISSGSADSVTVVLVYEVI